MIQSVTAQQTQPEKKQAESTETEQGEKINKGREKRRRQQREREMTNKKKDQVESSGKKKVKKQKKRAAWERNRMKRVGQRGRGARGWREKNGGWANE